MNTTAGVGSQGDTSRFFASQGTTESRSKHQNTREKSITSGIYSPRSRGNNDSNVERNKISEKANMESA